MLFRTRPALAGSVITLACLSSVPAAAPARAVDDAVARQLRAILHGHGVRNAVLGAAVLELPSGRIIYADNAETPLTPASNAKLVVIAAALHRLGPDFTFDTTFARRGDDLLVIGGGDPAFGDPKLCAARGRTTTAVFDEWAAALRRTGVHRAGRLVIDDSIFDSQRVHAGWPSDQFEAWYEAPIGGLNLADNCVVVSATPGRAGRPARLAMTPANAALKLVNNTTTSKTHAATVRRTAGSAELVVSGRVARAGRLAEITVPDPGLYFASALRERLAAGGVRLDGPILRQRVRLADGSPPPGLHVIAVHRTPICDVLARAGRDSLGVMAEGLIKRLGVGPDGVGTWPRGAAAVEAFVQSCGASPEQVRFDDGSGLSRGNGLSAAAAVAVLRQTFAHPQRDLFMDCLAQPGHDGTLERRMRELKGRVFAKTGYINGVRTLAGYLHARDGRWLAFAFFYNQARATQPLTRAQDEACKLLVNGVGPPPAAGTPPVGTAVPRPGNGTVSPRRRR